MTQRYLGVILELYLDPAREIKNLMGPQNLRNQEIEEKENWADWNRGRILAVSLSFAFKGFPNLSCFHIHLNKEGFLGWSCTCCFQLFTRVDGCFCEQFYWLFGLFLYNLALSPYGLSIFFFKWKPSLDRSLPPCTVPYGPWSFCWWLSSSLIY